MKEVSDIVLFLGRFHPLVVHLPIGFLIFAFILEILSKYQKKEVLNETVPLALFLGAISAIIACILGYMLSLSGDYDGDALDKHFWFGMATTVLSILAWVLKTGRIKNILKDSVRLNIGSLTFIVVLLSITGHYGGNLTHGSDYLTAYLPFGKKEKEKVTKIKTVEEAQIFAQVVNPIFQKKCASCHNSSKKKGGLSLEDKLSILKGGKSGECLIAGNSSQSELIKRVHLDPKDEAFMPPEGKTPLTEHEIRVIEYWIDYGQASFEATVVNVETPEDIKNLLREQLGLDEDHNNSGIKIGTAPGIPDGILENLRSHGVTIRELMAETNQLDISIQPSSGERSNEKRINKLLEEISKIKNNIVWLSIPSNEIEDENLKTIGTLKIYKN